MTVLIDVQQMDNLEAVTSRLPKPLQLQSHLTAASNVLDCQDSAVCPNPFLHQAARQSSQIEHRLQTQQPAVAKQCQEEATSVFMSSNTVDNLTDAVLLGSSAQPHHQLQPQHAGGEAPLQRLGIRQLQELLGMNTLGKNLNQLHDGQCTTTNATSSTTSMTSRLLPQKRPHANICPLLHPSIPAAAFAAPSNAPASGQHPMRHSLADTQTALWSQLEAPGAFRSQRASLTSMLSTHAASACELPQGCGQPLPQQQTVFLRPFQIALQAPRDTAARPTSGQNPRANFFTQSSEPASGRPLSFSLPSGPQWQGSSFASTEVGSNSKLSSSTSSTGLLVGACQSQAASTTLPQDALDMSISPCEKLSQRSSCMFEPLRPNRWHNLASQAVAPPSSSHTPSDTVPGSSRLTLQDRGLQCQPACAISSMTSTFCAKSQWFEGPDAMHEAALMLNAQLAHIDKQVLEHVVPHCGQQGNRGPGPSDTSIIQAQVSPTCCHCSPPSLLSRCQSKTPLPPSPPPPPLVHPRPTASWPVDLKLSDF